MFRPRDDRGLDVGDRGAAGAFDADGVRVDGGVEVDDGELVGARLEGLVGLFSLLEGGYLDGGVDLADDGGSVRRQRDGFGGEGADGDLGGEYVGHLECSSDEKS